MFWTNSGSAARPRARGRRAGFTLRELLASIVCLSMLGWLGCMWLNQAHETTYRRGCLSNIRMLSLALVNHESSLKRFPVVSDAAGPLHQIPPGTLGSDETNASGYSWLVKLLPYMEERLLYDDIRDASGKFETRPFHPDVAYENGPHIAAQVIWSLRCPNFSGDDLVEFGGEYDDMAFVGGEPAISNYVAIVGTHAAGGKIVENGVIVSRCENATEGCDGKGLQLKDVGDGISNTVVICETREPLYAAWIDGQATWVVGLDPAGAGAIQSDGVAGASATMLNRGAYSMIALGEAWPGRALRDWGPSSEHPGVVHHAFADNHAEAFSADIDPSVYYRYITRSSGDGRAAGCGHPVAPSERQ